MTTQLRVRRQQDQQRGAAEDLVQERHGRHREEPERPVRKVLLVQRRRKIRTPSGALGGRGDGERGDGGGGGGGVRDRAAVQGVGGGGEVQQCDSASKSVAVTIEGEYRKPSTTSLL